MDNFEDFSVYVLSLFDFGKPATTSGAVSQRDFQYLLELLFGCERSLSGRAQLIQRNFRRRCEYEPRGLALQPVGEHHRGYV